MNLFKQSDSRQAQTSHCMAARDVPVIYSRFQDCLRQDVSTRNGQKMGMLNDVSWNTSYPNTSFFKKKKTIFLQKKTLFFIPEILCIRDKRHILQ
jgi:uncharacterized protein YrrD